MSESEKQPHISLTINQDVFIDSVQVQDTVADATVSTEVTSFDKSGSLYVLEGAVVFTGYVSRNSVDSVETPHTGGPFPGLADGALSAGKNFHYRMPFVLKVPIAVQPRGVVNVASRITQWELEVVGDGWLHVESDLTIVGLNASGGYEFQCGTQTMGSLEGLFSRSSKESSKGLEQVSAARGGSPVYQDEVVERSELTHLDRKVAEESVQETAVTQPTDLAVKNDSTDDGEVNTQSSKSSDQSEVVRKEVSKSADENWETDTVAAHAVSEFDFQYQVDFHEDTAHSQGQTPSLPSGQTPLGPEALRVHLEVDTGHQRMSEQSSVRFDEASELTDSSEEVRRGEGKKDEDLWSFVDFNSPEKIYTLRYVIITEEESLATVAQRLGCSEDEIVQLNQLTAETVTVGQVLQIPS